MDFATSPARLLRFDFQQMVNWTDIVLAPEKVTSMDRATQLLVDWHVHSNADLTHFHESYGTCVRELQLNHDTGIWYRGQTATYCSKSHLILEQNGKQYGVAEHHVDSWLPTTYRYGILEGKVCGSKKSTNGKGYLSWPSELRQQYVLAHGLRELAPLLRFCVADTLPELRAFLLKRFEQYSTTDFMWMSALRMGGPIGQPNARDGEGGLAPFESSTDPAVPRWYAECVALMQHYEYGTCMTDVTKDPEVAGFFASYRAQRKPDSMSVIYRFNLPKYSSYMNSKEFLSRNKLVRETLNGDRYVVANPFGIVDIAEIPDLPVKRPRVQRAGAMYGSEPCLVHVWLQRAMAIEAHFFPSNTCPEDMCDLEEHFLGNEPEIPYVEEWCDRPDDEELLILLKDIYRDGKELNTLIKKMCWENDSDDRKLLCATGRCPCVMHRILELNSQNLISEDQIVEHFKLCAQDIPLSIL